MPRTNATPPPEPVIFMKSTTAIVGPNGDIMIPKDSVKTDWEVELAVVIGKKAVMLTKLSDGLRAGYYCTMMYRSVNSTRTQWYWTKGKDATPSAPLGPFLATADK